MRIKQTMLQELVEYRKRIFEQKRFLRQLEGQLKEREASVIENMEPGVKIEKGKVFSAIDTKSRVVPKWKELFADRLGAREVQKAIEETEPTLTKKLVLMVDGEEV